VFIPYSCLGRDTEQPLLLQEETVAGPARVDKHRTLDPLLLRGLGEGPELALDAEVLYEVRVVEEVW
jgi:hypothetical protein